MLQFGNDETIDVVAIGDQTAWAWAKVRNLLFLRPSISPARRTNAQVVTLRKDGTQRIYQLDLVPGDAGAPVFGINFAYPADLAEARHKAAAERTAQIASDQAKGRLQTSYFMGARNWAYVARGSVFDPAVRGVRQRRDDGVSVPRQLAAAGHLHGHR